MKNKIEYIEKILNNESKLEEYINFIEEQDIVIPSNLKQGLLKNFENNKISKMQEIFENMIKILKISACTGLALITWNILPQEPIKIPTNYYINQTHYKEINGLMSELNKFLMTPIKYERNEE